MQNSFKRALEISDFSTASWQGEQVCDLQNSLSLSHKHISQEIKEMGSSYFGEPNLGNEKGGGSSSRKSKKNNSDKPKQPQRGLGVAQLEKIRLHGQMGCAYHPSLHGPYPTNFNNVKSFLSLALTCLINYCFEYI